MTLTQQKSRYVLTQEEKWKENWQSYRKDTVRVQCEKQGEGDKVGLPFKPCRRF